MEKKWTWILIGISIVVVVGIMGVFFLQNESTDINEKNIGLSPRARAGSNCEGNNGRTIGSGTSCLRCKGNCNSQRPNGYSGGPISYGMCKLFGIGQQWQYEPCA